MGSIPYALSIHNFITKVGSDAGFAAIIGLAILVLLYFSQARETSSLREQADESAQRVQQLEARLAQLSRPQASAAVQPAPPPPGVARAAVSSSVPSAPLAAAQSDAIPASAGEIPASAGEPARIEVPAAPAGVGAPALATATRLIPTPAGAPPLVPQPVAASVAAQPVDATAAGTAVPGRPLDETSVGTPPPATAAALAGGNGAARDPVAAPAGYAGGSGGSSGGRSAAVQSVPPRVQMRPGGGAPGAPRPTPLLHGLSRESPASPGRRWLAVLIAALAALAVVAGLLIITSTGGGNQPSKNAARNSNAPATGQASHRSVPVFEPSSVTVAVLNGTSTSGAAARWAGKLVADGYKKGNVTNGPDQTRTATTVAYMPGFRRDALQVAKSLNLGSGSVQQVDSTTQTFACGQAPSCSANVVVTLGADLASRA